ncbi:MAG: hypothetical protein ACPGUV_15065 [Polyangiales bacterium]
MLVEQDVEHVDYEAGEQSYADTLTSLFWQSEDGAWRHWSLVTKRDFHWEFFDDDEQKMVLEEEQYTLALDFDPPAHLQVRHVSGQLPTDVRQAVGRHSFDEMRVIAARLESLR